MKRIRAFVLWALVAGPLFGVANAQIIPGVGDINRLIQKIAQQQVATISPPVLQKYIPHKALYQYGLAPVIVGLAPNGLPIGYRLVLLAAVPGDIEEADEIRVRAKISGIVGRIGVELRKEIDELPGLEEPDATKGQNFNDVRKHFADYAAQTNSRAHESFRSASTKFHEQFGHSFPKYATSSFLAIGLRPCADSACLLSEFAHSPRNRSTDRFGKLYGWMKSKGLATPNQAYILNPQGSFLLLTAKLDKGYEWHDDFPKAVLQTALVNAAKQARRTQMPLSYSAAELAGLSKDAAAHIADVFDSAYAAAIRLPSSPNTVLVGISDEIGRARLTECVRLRGAFDAAEVGTCAGYKMTPILVATCLAGKECAPPFGDHINLESIGINGHMTLAYLAQNASLPRVKLGSIDQVVATADKCKSTKREDAAYCLVETSLGRDPKTAKTLKCIHSTRDGGAGALENCATIDLPKEQQAQIACFQNNSKNYKGLAICAVGKALPPNAQKFIGCASKEKLTAAGFQEAAACLGAVAGTREAVCLAENKNAWQDAARCMAGDRVPPQVKSALDCAEASNSLSGFGVCMVAKEGSGEAQRIAACYVEGQGVPAAIAVCLEAKNLTQDQRIVLECAAETNGAPQATAICAGGKMAAKEMGYCKGKNFGEGKCFGENNELRKVAKNFGIEIGPHSVPADIINVQLRIADATTTPLLEEGTKVAAPFIKVAGEYSPHYTNPTMLTLVNPYIEPAQQAVRDLAHYCDNNPCPKVELKIGGTKIF